MTEQEMIDRVCKKTLDWAGDNCTCSIKRGHEGYSFWVSADGRELEGGVRDSFVKGLTGTMEQALQVHTKNAILSLKHGSI